MELQHCIVHRLENALSSVHRAWQTHNPSWWVGHTKGSYFLCCLPEHGCSSTMNPVWGLPAWRASWRGNCGAWPSKITVFANASKRGAWKRGDGMRVHAQAGCWSKFG
eukprot:1152455-Pelagomonas_calceolata.AAC.3